MDLNSFIISEDLRIIDAMEMINHNEKGVAFICKDNKLTSVVTDGDIRRHLLNNGNLEDPVTAIANRNAKFLYYGEAVDSIAYMKENAITAVPIIDEHGKILSISFLTGDRIYKSTNLNIPVVIMAGGKGSRLFPYTQILPKPLIPIGEKTITEHIMDKFEAFGCNQFNMIVNYKKNLIKSFFLDNEQERIIEFTEENDFLGTGGGLKLLEGNYEHCFFMTNCDVILEEDYSEIVAFHKNHQNIITMVCAMKNVTIPYGTVEISENRNIIAMKEKPSFSFMTNTGFYLIEPAFLKYIPQNTFIHITDVIQSCIDSGEKVGAYPVSENAWMDMGQLEELEKMKDKLK